MTRRRGPPLTPAREPIPTVSARRASGRCVRGSPPRLHRDEQQLGDLAIGLALRDDLGDPMLGGTELIADRGGGADPGQPRPCPCFPGRCPEPVERRGGLFQARSCDGPSLGPTSDLAVYEQGPRQLERPGCSRMFLQGSLQRIPRARQIPRAARSRPLERSAVAADAGRSTRRPINGHRPRSRPLRRVRRSRRALRRRRR